MEKKSKKKNSKKLGKNRNTSINEPQGIDWDLYERMYNETGFAKQFKKSDEKSSNLPGRTLKRTVKKTDVKDRDAMKNMQSENKPGKTFDKSKAGTKHDSDTKRSTKKHNGVPASKKQAKSTPKFTASGEAICGHNKKCGGCVYQGIEYAKQLAMKQKRVEELLGKFGKVEPIIGMKDPLNYRNKVHATFDRDRNGNYISGTYKEGTHEVVAIDDCIIQNKTANEIIKSIRGLLKSFKIKTYDEDTGYGLLRHVMIRTGYHTGEVMVVLVLGSPILPSKNNFVKALRKLHPEITTVIINVNDKQTSMVLGERETTIYGKGFIEDELCGLRFRISPKSFSQVNPVQTEVMYNTAIKLADLNGKQKVIDAYCGIGTIGMIASKHAKEVIGVELNQDAVKDARINAKLNGIKNVSFYNNDAGRFMVEMAEQGETADVVFMDPPRAGSDETFMDCVGKLNPKKVIYVSCNPETLARDLEYMKKIGYRVVRMVPVDNFPYTNHIEMIVSLKRKEN